jgi:hypothetical protein
LNARTLLWLECYSIWMLGLCCGWNTIQFECQDSAVAGILFNSSAPYMVTFSLSDQKYIYLMEQCPISLLHVPTLQFLH